MTDFQIRNQNMARATKEALDDNQPLWVTTPAIGSQYTLMNNSIVRVNTLAVLQEKDNTGYREEKLDLLNEMADLTMVIAGPLASYARINNDKSLLEKVDIVRTDITRGSEVTGRNTARSIHDEAIAIDPAELAEVGITPDMLTDQDEAIEAFSVSIPTPRNAEDITKAATEALTKEFTGRRKILTTMDGLIEPFRITNIDFYNTYHNARILVGTGVRKIHLIVKCFDSVSGVVVPGAEVTIVQLSESLTTTVTGNARFFSLPTGTYTVTINHPNYAPVTLEHVGIEPKKTARFELLLEMV